MCDNLFALVSERLHRYFEGEHQIKVMSQLNDSMQATLRVMSDVGKIYRSESNSEASVLEISIFQKLCAYIPVVAHDMSFLVRSNRRRYYGVFPAVVNFLLRLIEGYPAVLSEHDVAVGDRVDESDIIPAKRFLMSFSKMLLSDSKSEDEDENENKDISLSESDLQACYNFMCAIVVDVDRRDTDYLLRMCGIAWDVIFSGRYDCHVFLGNLSEDGKSKKEIIKIRVPDLIEFSDFLESIIKILRRNKSSEKEGAGVGVGVGYSLDSWISSS